MTYYSRNKKMKFASKHELSLKPCLRTFFEEWTGMKWNTPANS